MVVRIRFHEATAHLIAPISSIGPIGPAVSARLCDEVQLARPASGD